MSGPANKSEPSQLFALLPTSMRDSVAIIIAGSTDDWHVEVRTALTPPGEKLALQPDTFRLPPSVLRGMASALVAIADAADVPLVTTYDADEVEQAIREAPEHLKAIVAVVGVGRATLLAARPGNLVFRAIADGPTILIVDDAAAQGPGDFDLVCLGMALKRTGLIVLTVEWRVPEHYCAAALKARDGSNVVIIETAEAAAMAWMAYLAAEVPDVEVLTVPIEAKAETSGRMN